MTAEQIAADIARGTEIRKLIASLEKELEEIEARLENAALKGEHVPLQDKEREGKQCLLRGGGNIVPVRFESDMIAGEFKPDSEMHKAVVDALGDEHKDKIVSFFKDTRTFKLIPKDGKAFRALARELLDSDTFAKLIHAATSRGKGGIAKSKTVIAWDDARPADKASSL